MSGAYSEDEIYDAVSRSPLDEAGRAALVAVRWSGAAALAFGSLLLYSGLRSFPAVIALAGLLMAVWIAIAAFVGLMRGLST
jgi:hypothetical protein